MGIKQGIGVYASFTQKKTLTEANTGTFLGQDDV